MATETKGTPVNLRKRVDVVGIKHKDPKKQKLEAGKVYSVHPTQAENLIKTGHATEVKEKK